jgi:predicted membrane chloride channel (bestrophin family)
MPRILALVLIAIVALTVLSFTIHILFSPWLLVAIGILVWVKFRPRRAHQPHRDRHAPGGGAA